MKALYFLVPKHDFPNSSPYTYSSTAYSRKCVDSEPSAAKRSLVPPQLLRASYHASPIILLPCCVAANVDGETTKNDQRRLAKYCTTSTHGVLR